MLISSLVGGVLHQQTKSRWKRQRSEVNAAHVKQETHFSGTTVEARKVLWTHRQVVSQEDSGSKVYAVVAQKQRK